MRKKPKVASRVLNAVHETARDLHAAGFIDKRRMRQYDALCLVPVPDYSSRKIRALRGRYKLSQAVLASVRTPASPRSGNGRSATSIRAVRR